MAKTHTRKASVPAPAVPGRVDPPRIEPVEAIQPRIILAYVAGPGGSIGAERREEYPVATVPRDRIFVHEGMQFEFVGPDDQGRRVYRTVMRG